MVAFVTKAIALSTVPNGNHNPLCQVQVIRAVSRKASLRRSNS